MGQCVATPFSAFISNWRNKKCNATFRLSSDQASKLAMLSSDMDRLFEDMALAVRGKTSGTPAPSSEAVAADLHMPTYSQLSKKTRRATLASAPTVPPRCQPLRSPWSRVPHLLGLSSHPLLPATDALQACPGPARLIYSSRPSTEVTYGGSPIQQPRASHDAAPNPPSSTARGISSSLSLPQSKTYKGYSVTGRSSHTATAPDNILNLDGVNQPDKDPTAGTGPRILRRRELDSTSITNGNFRYANRNDIPALQAASQGSHGAAYRSPASTTPRDGEITCPGRTIDGHEIRYYDSCMVVGPDSAVVPYLPEGSRDVPGTLMQHRPHSRRR
ncbi:hypothetical protein BS47DRAFT_219050 [Hydnum rufescens UP504]|uniref:Uncharacterized protein n=1 Tax=Hydnum rufescens UP504 TaxID=1448309 RepID=A0A9P6APF9_9AGAM|nr:hypothetical protein BS47DRAFT_219050 [Hydnum rufescens UP504]